MFDVWGLSRMPHHNIQSTADGNSDYKELVTDSFAFCKVQYAATNIPKLFHAENSTSILINKTLKKKQVMFYTNVVV